MAELTVIVPSRERPGVVGDLVEAFAATCTRSTRLVFAVDSSDPTRHGYLDSITFAGGWTSLTVADSTNMVEALNTAASTVETAYVGFLGDDHRPRTKGWDQRYVDALDELGTGIVYGDDLLQRERLPTQCAMTSDIVRTLGYMSPPTLVHMYVDDAWLHLGRAAGCIRYLPDVVVEHVHPVAGKAEWDDGYRRVNDPAVYGRDRVAFARWQATDMPEAVRKIRALRGES